MNFPTQLDFDGNYYQIIFDDEDDELLILLWYRRIRRRHLHCHHQAEEALRRHRIRRYRANLNYLKRAELMPNPRVNSGWQAIYQSRDDRAYIHVLGMPGTLVPSSGLTQTKREQVEKALAHLMLLVDWG
ncbi:DDE family endonuclease [Ceratobasidium theobromae]|uniref:DDE family endonuclease n=1 Tax=Ceratobasidium theobromae TaxID=1582974 RepID=A0A5N5Q7C7_9AGAM|nr:DDE family endonuclease [Ceratobasidium theobromae]